jgi:hypothetical protein
VSEAWDAQNHRDAKALVAKATDALSLYALSSELEVQERVSDAR